MGCKALKLDSCPEFDITLLLCCCPLIIAGEQPVCGTCEVAQCGRPS